MSLIFIFIFVSSQFKQEYISTKQTHIFLLLPRVPIHDRFPFYSKKEKKKEIGFLILSLSRHCSFIFQSFYPKSLNCFFFPAYKKWGRRNWIQILSNKKLWNCLFTLRYINKDIKFLRLDDQYKPKVIRTWCKPRVYIFQ